MFLSGYFIHKQSLSWFFRKCAQVYRPERSERKGNMATLAYTYFHRTLEKETYSEA